LAKREADLALLFVPAEPSLGSEYPYGVAYQEPVALGDFTYVFGFPKEIKQLTSGLVSPLPYEGFFMVDAVARHGFSGGPVFVVRPEQEIMLAGIIRGVTSDKLHYVQPPDNSVEGQNLDVTEITKSSAQTLDLINYGAAYAVDSRRIGRFLRECSHALATKRIFLDSRFLYD